MKNRWYRWPENKEKGIVPWWVIAWRIPWWVMATVLLFMTAFMYAMAYGPKEGRNWLINAL